MIDPYKKNFDARENADAKSQVSRVTADNVKTHLVLEIRLSLIMWQQLYKFRSLSTAVRLQLNNSVFLLVPRRSST